MTTTFAGELLLQYANELVRSGKDLRSIIMGYSKANDLVGAHCSLIIFMFT